MDISHNTFYEFEIWLRRCLTLVRSITLYVHDESTQFHDKVLGYIHSVMNRFKLLKNSFTFEEPLQFSKQKCWKQQDLESRPLKVKRTINILGKKLDEIWNGSTGNCFQNTIEENVSD
ncbi:jg23910 [Pararge aegeria aegeria]|uniref:Jg23910 protein n=1 Tax=Pararge aegeria aegeria TaxID=348720 RepID=A0A8S4S410_9NEOP|nr:jg23910 [Pararge aegeria aegeria]